MSNNHSNDHDDLITTMEVVKQNAKAIDGLTRTIDQLAKVLEKEDSKQRELINKLMTNAEKCESRHQDFVKRFDNKASAIKELNEKIDTKVSLSTFEKVTSRLWTIGGSVVAILIGSIGYMIKTILEGITHG